MNTRRYRSSQAVLGLTLALAACASVARVSVAALATHSEPLALQVMELLRAGETSRASSLFHFPATYSAEEREQDRALLQESLEVLLEVLGGPVEFSIETSPAEYFEVGIFGGTNPYWESLPNAGIDARHIFSVRFSKVEGGIANVALFHNSGRWEVRSVGLGVKKGNDQAIKIIEQASGRIIAIVQRE